MRIIFIDITHERGINHSNINFYLHSKALKAICSTEHLVHGILTLNSDYSKIEYEIYLYSNFDRHDFEVYESRPKNGVISGKCR